MSLNILSSLIFQFASQAKQIKNKPHVNEVLSDRAMLKKYQREIEKLQKMLNKVCFQWDFQVHRL